MSAAANRLDTSCYKTTLKPVWCPGCGDYGVLNALHHAMAELELKTWNTVLLSGIGCSSRLPGYVDCYGFNGVHGRALTLATGVKVAKPELTVIAVGGDGDGLAQLLDNLKILGSGAEGPVQVHHVQPGSAHSLPLLSHGRRVVAVHRLPVGLPLDQAHTFAAPDINGWEYNHFLILSENPQADNPGVQGRGDP